MSGKLIVDTITTDREDLDLIVDNNLQINGTINASNIGSNADYNDILTELTSIKERLTLLESYSKILNITTVENAERRELPTAASIEMESFIVNKKSPTSFLLIQGTISGHGGYSGDMQQQWQYGNQIVNAQSVMYDENNYGRIFTTTALISDFTDIGDHIMTFRYLSVNGGGNYRPFIVYNPNNSVESLNQTKSVYIVWEIER